MIDNPGNSQNAVLENIEAARAQGLLIHQMMDQKQYPGATAWLAEQGLVTTVEPRYPGKFWGEFRPARAADRELDKLATNADEALGAREEFMSASREQRLGSLMVKAFGAVRSVDMKDLHVTKVKKNRAGKVVDSTVAAEWTTFGVEAVEERDLLFSALQTLLRLQTIDPKKFHALRIGTHEKNGLHTISVSHMNEYTTRIMEAAIAKIVTKEDEHKTGTKLPRDRVPLSTLNEQGETCVPVVMERMTSINQDYEMLSYNVSATYKEGTSHTSLQDEIEKKPEVLTATPAAVFEILRKGYNTVIREIRGSGQYNQDQNQDESWHLVIEKDVYIKREPGKPDQPGPPRTRAYKARERMQRKGKGMVTKQLSRPFKAVTKAITTAITAGAEVFVDVATELGPSARSGGVRLYQDYRAWRQQKQAAEEAGKRIDEALAKAKRQN